MRTWLAMAWVLLALPTILAKQAPRHVLYIVVDDLTANLELFGGEIKQVSGYIMISCKVSFKL
jgi:hypothetical protein